MIYVVFEVVIKANCMDNYLRIVSDLKGELNKVKGFVRSERFQSLATENKLLSLSLWESEEAVNTWRNQVEHRLSQRVGRDSIFESYQISVLSSIRSYGDDDRREAPADSNVFIFGEN
ncbi:antibiotic biosynthesis monooxygenase family protein [Fundicoccus culcitae]|uniref:Antibiotic biosynthesis monooxygenase n=1 Tax=Fundicoccus culcitae TaxID=2969821 RepID=A0ABY5P465_9LACT|nr:antibiotic biosynthesis monooxygenase [Fundicoccus culcitae]UUX33376.1 antibiotic biosynthesis monooxygenase [Fundicoccus culcitae]